MLMKNFNEFDIELVEKIVENTINNVTKGYVTKEELKKFIDFQLGEDFIKNTIQGHGYSKPHGYAGDYEIIDFIYTKKISKIPKYKPWDEYFHLQSAPRAVRNRKEYFKEQLFKILPNGGSLLNVASGPGRDLFEIYNKNPTYNLITTCVEMDKNAIEYAKKINKNNLFKIDFVNKNIFRFTTDKRFDMIWAAGLFDYFDDKAFILLLKRFREWINEGGEIIIGNFNEDYNPSRLYMEIFGDWYLNHRTDEKLVSLAKLSGFEESKIMVGREPENVNLFLHVRK